MSESSQVTPVKGILYEFDMLYNRDISRRTEIAILRRAPGGVWEVFYYMGGYRGLTQGEDEPGEVFEDRKERDLERRIVEAKARVQLHRWTARKDFLNDEFPEHERVTRPVPENPDHERIPTTVMPLNHLPPLGIDHSMDCSVNDYRPSPCNCDLSDDTILPLHVSDCAVHNEPAMPAGPCNCDLAEHGGPADREKIEVVDVPVVQKFRDEDEQAHSEAWDEMRLAEMNAEVAPMPDPTPEEVLHMDDEEREDMRRHLGLPGTPEARMTAALAEIEARDAAERIGDDDTPQRMTGQPRTATRADDAQEIGPWKEDGSLLLTKTEPLLSLPDHDSPLPVSPDSIRDPLPGFADHDNPRDPHRIGPLRTEPWFNPTLIDKKKR